MEILKACLEEVSLSGLEGCTIDELWKFLGDRQPPISFKLDEYIKPLAWKQLLKCAENSNAVQFYKLPVPRDPKQAIFETTVGSSLQWMEYRHPLPYRPINDATTGTRGSCANFSTRLNVTSEVVSKQLDLAGVSESYGNSLVLVASQELRERSLVPITQSPPGDINDVQYCLLEVVGCSRHYGTCRPYITNKYFKIDARSLYHHSKELKKHGLVVIKTERRSASDNINRTQLSHVIYLTRFAPPTDSAPDMISFEAHICQLLEEAPHQTLPLKTLQEKLGTKKLKAAKAILVKKGYVKSVIMGNVKEEFSNDPELAKARGVQLVKPYEESEEGGGGDEGEERDEDDEGEEGADQVPLVTELPLTSQAYRVIDSYGAHGITNQDFCMRKGLTLDYYANRALAKSLIKQSKVFAITSDSSNIRTVVLVSDRHLQSNAEYIRLQEEKAKSGDMSVEVAVVTGERYQKEKRVKKEKETATTTEEGVPLIGIPNYCQFLPSQQMVEKEEGGGEGETGDEPAGRQNRLNQSDDTMMEVGSVVSEADSASVTGNSIPDLESNVMTYHQLRRCNIIMEFMRQHRVVQGYVDLTKCLRDVEKSKVEKKTISKLLQRLVQNQRIHRRDDLLEAHFEDDSVVNYQPTVFWHVPDATEGEIMAAKEKAVQRFYYTVQRRNIRKKGKGRKKKKKQVNIESSSEEEEEDVESESEDDDEEDEMEVDFFSKIQCSAKFQRLRHLHYYLWILAFGRDPIEDSEPGGDKMDSEAKQDTGTAASRREKEEDKQKLDLILPETNYPWARAVSRLPQSSKGEGWLQFSEVHHYMPLSLWLIVIKLYRGKAVGKLPGKYRKYFEDLELKNRLLHQLPRKLRKIIVHGGRDMTHICDFLKQLSELGLIALEGWDTKNKTTVSIHLSRSVTVLNTSTAQPRSSFFSNEARHLFQPIRFSLDSLADVERFWFKLQIICRQTPIILRDRPQKSDSDLALKDSYPLLYSSKIKIYKYKDMEYNMQGFGAGGLPPLYFSHLSRNWKTSGQHARTLEDSTTARRELGPWASLEVGGAYYMPGEGLLQLPSVSMETDNNYDDDDGEIKDQSELVSSGGLPLEAAGGFVRGEDVRGLPPAKRAKLMAGVSVVPSSQVKRNEGGRGRERFRAKKAGGRKSKSSDASSSTSSSATPSVSSTYRYRFAQTTAMYIADAPATGETEPVAAVPSGVHVPERIRWNSEEDTFLLQSYLTAVVMKELGQPLVTYSTILSAFHSKFPSSAYKNTTALKRRLNALVKKKVELAANMELFVTETLHMMNALAENCPEATFESILEFVHKIYQSEDGGFSLAHVVCLPQTLQELHDNYKVVGGLENKPSFHVPADSEQDIKQALLFNLIIASIGSDQSSFDQYKAFKLFESFHEENLEAAMNELKNHYLVKLKKTAIGIPRHQGPYSTASYTLSANFFSRLESHYFVSHLRDMEGFRKTFDTQLAPAPTGGGHVTSDPAISLVDGGLIMVDGETHVVRNGTTAAVVEALMANKNLLDCSSEFPDPLFEPGNEVEEGGGDSEGEGEEEEGREDSSQAARQLVKTAMKEAELERGTNSDNDEDDDDGTMEFGEGGASEEVGGAGASSQVAMETSALRYRGGGFGITSLFNLGAGVLRHRPVTLTPGLSVAKLLDPLTTDSEERSIMTEDLKETTSVQQSSLDNHPALTCSSAAEQTDSLRSSTSTENGGTPSSLEIYLVSVGKELGFSESDVWFAVALHDVVASSGKFGITKESLTTHPSLSGLQHQHSINEHIQNLINLEMIHSVGINEELLVSHSNSNFWSMTPEDVANGDAPFISYLPWSSVSSSDPNVTMMTSYCHGILNYILANPGVPMDAIAEQFKAVLQPTGLQRILNMLEWSGHIRKYSTVDCSKTCHLFDGPSRTTMVSCTYYEPVL